MERVLLKLMNLTTEELLLNEKFYDLTDVTADKKTLHLYKGILACRSPVFQTMFANDMVEKLKSIVNIEDFSYNVLLEMFRFIYCGKIKNMEPEILCELMRAAEKYCIEELKLLCEQTMLNDRNIDNVFEFIISAHMNNSNVVQNLILWTVSKIITGFITKTKLKLLERSHPHLFNEVTNVVKNVV